MTSEEKELAVVEIILQLVEVQALKNPMLKNGSAIFVQEVLSEVMDVLPEDAEKIIRKLNRLGVIGYPPFKPDLFICHTEKLTNYKNRLVKIIGEAKIVGKIEIEGLKEVLETIAKVKKDDGKPKFPYKLPAGTMWENFIIKFLNNENVLIKVKQFKHTASYKEMGFVGKGNNPNPSVVWKFLKVLASVNGELKIKDPESRDKYKKQKELLVKSLRNYFSLDYDPFYPYHSSLEKRSDSYKIKIILIPPPTENEKLDIEEGKDDIDSKKYYNEQTPQVYEDK